MQLYSDQERIEFLKKTVINLTDKLTRSYTVIRRLNHQNNFLMKENLRLKRIKQASVLFLALSLFSCEPKEAEYCWSCRVTKTVYSQGGSGTTITTVMECGMSTREAELYEQNNNAVCTKSN